jgi:hypothetical protein
MNYLISLDSIGFLLGTHFPGSSENAGQTDVAIAFA